VCRISFQDNECCFVRNKKKKKKVYIKWWAFSWKYVIFMHIVDVSAVIYWIICFYSHNLYSFVWFYILNEWGEILLLQFMQCSWENEDNTINVSGMKFGRSQKLFNKLMPDPYTNYWSSYHTLSKVPQKMRKIMSYFYCQWR
jgi:hypothetical protein